MAEKDDEMADITERLVALGSPQKMKAVLTLALIALREKEAKDRMDVKTTSQPGNSDEVIAQLKKDYDFSGVGAKELKEAQKWFMAARPSASRWLGPDVTASYYQWCKWNPTGTGNHHQAYKGDLIKKREETEAEEMVVAMAAVRVAE